MGQRYAQGGIAGKKTAAGAPNQRHMTTMAQGDYRGALKRKWQGRATFNRKHRLDTLMSLWRLNNALSKSES